MKKNYESLKRAKKGKILLVKHTCEYRSLYCVSSLFLMHQPPAED